MLRGILFDFNGVLLDDEDVHFELFRRVLAERGVELERCQYDEQLVALDDLHGFRAALSAAGSSPSDDELTELIERKSRLYDEHMAECGFPFFPGAVEAVRAAHQAGLALGIVSGALRGEIEAALGQEGLLELVQVVIAAEDVVESKPDPEGYIAGLHHLQETIGELGLALEPGSVVAIEDTNEGLAAARGAGLRTVGVAQTFEAARLDADWVLGSIAELDIGALQRRFGGLRH